MEVSTIRGSKFNVSKDKSKRTYDGIVFDSKMEMEYYRDVILPGVESGEITFFDRQRDYVLQEGFEYKGKKVRPIVYKCDFYVEKSDGSAVVIDVKGNPDSIAMLKRKLMWHTYPDIDYVWVTNIKKFGGWRNYEDVVALRKEEKKKKKEAAENGEE